MRAGRKAPYPRIPTRSLHARAAAAPGDNFRLPEVGRRSATPDVAAQFRRPPPAARRRDRRRADGDARGAEGAASMIGAGRWLMANHFSSARDPATLASGHVTDALGVFGPRAVAHRRIAAP